MNTTVETDFLDNFHLIVDTEQNQSRLKFFCPIIDANSLSYDRLIISLRDAAGHYCLSRRTWDEYVRRPMQLSHLVREKFRKLGSNDGELGELLLFSFLETDLKAPKLLTKMELKTNPNLYFNGVHYLKLENGDYQLIFGESKVYSDLSDGISAALNSIRDFKNDNIKDDESGSIKGITFEKGLLNACIAQETYSEEERAFLKSLIYPNTSSQYNVDTAFAVFVLYNLEIDKKVKSKITRMLPSILERIERRGLLGHAFYFYLVPFEQMDENQKEVLTKVVE